MRAVVAAAVLAVVGCSGSTPTPDTSTVIVARVGPGGAWELSGGRIGGEPCLTLRDGDEVLGRRCGFEPTDLRTWEVTMVSFEERLVVFAPLPTTAVRVRIDGIDRSLHTVEARTALGFPGRYLLDEVATRAAPQVVRVFGRKGRAVVPQP